MLPTPSASANFGEVSSLREVFAEAKKLRQARHPAHVLVVEDDALTRRIVTGNLKTDYAMITACDASSAVAEYLMYAPDAVFLDIGLPDVDGFCVLEHIISFDPDAFVVMFSSHNDPQTIHKALAAGAKGFIAKPFKSETLRNYIQGSAIHYHKSFI